MNYAITSPPRSAGKATLTSDPGQRVDHSAGSANTRLSISLEKISNTTYTPLTTGTDTEDRSNVQTIQRFFSILLPIRNNTGSAASATGRITYGAATIAGEITGTCA